MVCKQKIKGRVYNISLNEQTLQKGWYLIVTDQQSRVFSAKKLESVYKEILCHLSNKLFI